MKKLITTILLLCSIIVSSQNNSLHFNGTMDNVNLPYNSAIDFSLTSSFSIEAWFKTNSFSNQTIFANKVDISPFKGLEIAIVSSKLVFEFANNYIGNTIRIQTINSYNDGIWHHFACVYKGIPNASNVDIYIDGILQSVNITDNNLTSAPNLNNGFHIGSRNNTAYFYTGEIDELRIWSKALCYNEIIARKNCQLVGNELQLEAYYNFNQGVPAGNNSTVTTLPDISGHNITGTLTTFALTGSTSNWIASTASVSGTCSYNYASIAGNTTICAGATTTLTASGATTYSWNFGSNSPSVTLSPSVTATYTLNTNNITFTCWGVTIVTVSVNPNPPVSVVSSNSFICSGSSASLTASGANSYSWSNSATGSTISISPTITTIYSVTGTNSITGCSNVASTSVSVAICNGFSTNQIGSENIFIYPNPSKGVFKINGIEKGVNLEIFNAVGMLVYNTVSDSDIAEINLTNYASGAYIIKCINSGKTFTKRIVKE